VRKKTDPTDVIRLSEKREVCKRYPGGVQSTDHRLQSMGKTMLRNRRLGRQLGLKPSLRAATCAGRLSGTWLALQMLLPTTVMTTGFGTSLMATSAQAQSAATAQLPDIDKRVASAREVTTTYAEKLKAELKQALKTGGPKAAVGACMTIPTELDTQLSEESSFDVGRTALKLRNLENTPDDWEKANLEAFVKRIASGADGKTLEAYDVTVTKEGQKLFRYMRPIMMGEMCLSCHGPNVAQDVKAEIARTYTDDKAVGFNLGELRGAFTLVQELE
jgi:Protein of unknown function (DUF3365)